MTSAPLTDSEMRDFLMRSNDFALAADNAGFAAVQAAAFAQRDTLVKARSTEVDSMGIAQVKADGEVTLSGLRARIDALKGRTASDEDSLIQAALTKATTAIKGDDKEAIINALAELDSTLSSVEAAVQKRENPTPEVKEVFAGDTATEVPGQQATEDSGTSNTSTQDTGTGDGGNADSEQDSSSVGNLGNNGTPSESPKPQPSDNAIPGESSTTPAETAATENPQNPPTSAPPVDTVHEHGAGAQAGGAPPNP
ncbi:hypothetical protein [Actinomyces trachealis]|uniref:hypothetical protein n=2 Tax=Actinomyces trachealis TaxID=2763540 RepID=UPI0018C679D1|nr:hypothetical protein [Actinomyces trachealis]